MEALLVISVFGAIMGLLIFAIPEEKKVGCQSPNCKCK